MQLETVLLTVSGHHCEILFKSHPPMGKKKALLIAFLIFYLETGSYPVAQAGWELAEIFLSPSPRCWDSK